VNYQLLNQAGLKEMTRCGKFRPQENSRRLHRHAPPT